MTTQQDMGRARMPRPTNGTPHITVLLLTIIIAIAAQTTLAYPAYIGTVNDFANIIEPADEASITAVIEDIKRNSTVEIAIITTNDLGGEDISMYSTNIGNEWGVGKKDKDNGLVLVIAPDERKYFFAVGTGLEGTLNDAKVARIGRNTFPPYFRRGEYGKGILEALATIKGILAQDPTIVSQYAETEDNQIADEYEGWFIFATFIIFALGQTITSGYKVAKLILSRFGIWGAVGIIVALISLSALWIVILLSFIFFIFTIFELAGKALGIKGKGFGGFGGSSGGGFSGGGFGGGGFSGGGGGGGW